MFFDYEKAVTTVVLGVVLKLWRGCQHAHYFFCGCFVELYRFMCVVRGR